MPTMEELQARMNYLAGELCRPAAFGTEDGRVRLAQELSALCSYWQCRTYTSQILPEER